jgi:hypothetical protein
MSSQAMDITSLVTHVLRLHHRSIGFLVNMEKTTKKTIYKKTRQSKAKKTLKA